MEDLNSLIQNVEREGEKTEKTIIFCQMMTEIASVVTLVESDTIYSLCKCYVIKLCKEYVLGI